MNKIIYRNEADDPNAPIIGIEMPREDRHMLRDQTVVITKTPVWVKMSVAYFRGDNPMVRRVSDGAQVTWWTLLSYMNEAYQAWPSQATLAERRGISRERINKHIKELSDLGLVRVEDRYDEQGRQLSSLYTIGGYAAFGASEPVIPDEDTTSKVKGDGKISRPSDEITTWVSEKPYTGVTQTPQVGVTETPHKEDPSINEKEQWVAAEKPVAPVPTSPAATPKVWSAGDLLVAMQKNHQNQSEVEGDDDEVSGPDHEGKAQYGSYTPFERYILVACKARHLSKDMRARLRKPMTWVGNGAMIENAPSPAELYENERSPYHEDYVDWLKLAFGKGATESGGRLSRSSAVSSACKFMPYKLRKTGQVKSTWEDLN